MTGLEIAAAIAGIRNSFDVAKNLADVKDEAKNAELIRAIACMNLELSRLESEIATKNRRILELEDEIAQKQKNQTVKRGSLWYSVEDNELCCKNCSDKHGRIVYLDEWLYSGVMVGYECPECDKKTPVEQA